MSHFDRLEANKHAENYVSLLTRIKQLKDRRRELSREIKTMSEDMDFIGEDLVEYMLHNKEVIPLSDGRVMQTEERSRRLTRDESDKKQAVINTVKSLKDQDEYDSDEVYKTLKTALGSVSSKKHIIVVADAKKLAQRNINRANRLAKQSKKQRDQRKKKERQMTPSSELSE